MAADLAMFDLDNTLLAGDSDYLWGCHLVDCQLVAGADYERRNRAFYDDYANGTLDIYAYLRFQLGFLAKHPRERLDAWHREFMESKIRPLILPATRELLRWHRERGDTLLIITATNRFVTAPIATELGVDHLLATEPEERDGRFTGEPTDTPCFREGKVIRLHRWLNERNASFAATWFYSDSHNDLPLLEMVDHPVAVDPDPRLRELAQQRRWRVISLRE